VRTGDVEPPAGFGPDDFRVPTFREVVERFPTVAFDVEIKGEGVGALPAAQELAHEIIDLGIEANTIVVSFDDGVVAAFEILAPKVETSPGTDELTAWVLLGDPLDDGHRIVQVPPAFGGVPVLTDAFWVLAAESGVDVWVWMDDPSSQDNVAFYQEPERDGRRQSLIGATSRCRRGG
jgi:glycerophosphoryl diester phosphodiesterase